MIIDTLDNFHKYVALNPLFGRVAEFLAVTDLSSCPSGRLEIESQVLYANFDVAKGKTASQARLEAHDVMIDIQIPLSCVETMGWSPRGSLPPADYDSQRDITFFEGAAEQYVTVHPGEFVIFFPQDAHAPCISAEAEIRKVIFKVKA